MRPVYDVDGITIYHADCADILPGIDPATVDLLLTDPPYGIGLETSTVHRNSGRNDSGYGKHYFPVVGDDEPFDPSPLLGFGAAVLFGANYYADSLPPSGCWVIWDKRRGGTVTPGWKGADCEMAWTTFDGGAKMYSHLWAGYKRDSEIHLHVHPTQKPVALMRWILEQWTEPGDLILDPYMGSGPVARACADLGRRYIGVEIVEEYVDAAIARLGQTAMVFD